MITLKKDINLRPFIKTDSEIVAKIYNYYIRNTIITFEEEPLSASEIYQRFQNIQSSSLPWLVAAQDEKIFGYAYASKWKDRCAYRFSTEVTVYLTPDILGYGIGSQLYIQLLTELRECKMHVAIAGIALPNESSIALHEKFGFKKVAHFKEVGFKFNRWIDVGYWQLIL